MGDSSSFTRQKLASAVIGGYLALKDTGRTKGNSIFAALQHSIHRPTPRPNKSYYNGTSTPTPPAPTPPAPSLQTQINTINFSNEQSLVSFASLNTLLRTATPEVISTTNATLRTYYNNLLPSLNIPAGTTFYILAGTNITAAMLSSIPANSYILIPDGYDITIDGKTVSVTNQKVVVDSIEYDSGDPIQVTNNVRTLDFLIAGSPALLQFATIYNLDVSPFPTTNFNNTARYFVLDTNNTRVSTNDGYWGVTPSKPNYPNPSTNPQFTSNINCDGLVSFAFTPTIDNDINDKPFISIILGTHDAPLDDLLNPGNQLSRIEYVDFIDSNGLRVSGGFARGGFDQDGIYDWGSLISIGKLADPVSGKLISGQKYYLVIKYKLPTELFLMNIMTSD